MGHSGGSMPAWPAVRSCQSGSWAWCCVAPLAPFPPRARLVRRQAAAAAANCAPPPGTRSPGPQLTSNECLEQFTPADQLPLAGPWSWLRRRRSGPGGRSGRDAGRRPGLCRPTWGSTPGRSARQSCCCTVARTGSRPAPTPWLMAAISSAALPWMGGISVLNSAKTALDWLLEHTGANWYVGLRWLTHRASGNSSAPHRRCSHRRRGVPIAWTGGGGPLAEQLQLRHLVPQRQTKIRRRPRPRTGEPPGAHLRRAISSGADCSASTGRCSIGARTFA